jgi:mRNA interferase MazF
MLELREQLMMIKLEMDKEELKNDNKLIEAKIEVKDLDINKQIKQVKIEVNNVHSNRNIADNKINNNIDLKDIEWGEVLYVNLDGGRWSEQNNDRFAICIQNEIGNKYSPTVIVAFVTSQQTKSKLPTHVEISAGQFGLPKDSIVMLEQVRTLDKRRIKSRVGVLDDITKKKIKIAKDISMNELQEKTPLEKLPRYMQNKINKRLNAIKNCEELIIETKTESLIDLLRKERSDLLYELQIYCEDNNLNYREFYMQCEKEKEVIAI